MDFDPRSRERLSAFLVHVFTAAGAGIGFMALLAATRGDFVTMFWWLGAALFVDGIDGTLARRYRVAETLPRWSGEALDFVVDFTTYVFVPAYAIVASGLVPAWLAAPLGVVIVVSSAIYFADREMKTDDNHFRGFPALWNGAAFYILLWKPSPWLTTIAVLALAVATFLPIRCIHPFRVERLKYVTFAVLIAGVLLAMWALHRNFDPGLPVTVALSLVGLYFLSGGLLQARS